MNKTKKIENHAYKSLILGSLYLFISKNDTGCKKKFNLSLYISPKLYGHATNLVYGYNEF